MGELHFIMDALEVMRTRRSVRSYLDKGVSKQAIETMVDCGRLAASARNVQPWEFVVVTDPDKRRTIALATDHGKHIEDAPVCILVFCEDSTYYLEDGCAATQNILLAASALGLGACWIAGDKKAYTAPIRELVEIPANYKLVSLISVGYPETIPNPQKRTLKEVIHWERFQR